MCKVVWDLAGGGSKGIFGAGAAKALHDSGIEFDGLVTSSIGTLNGLLIFQNKWDELYDLWMNCKTSVVYRHHWFKGLGKLSFNDTAPLRKLISNMIDLDLIRSNKKKFHINTTSFSSGQSITYEINEVPDEDLVDVLLASASPPIFFPPVNYKGDILVDAGITDNFGLTKSINLGYDKLYVIKYPPAKMKPVKNKIDALTNTISAAMDSDYHKEKAAVRKINELIDNCDEFLPSLRRIKIVEIVTDNPKELEYDFLDFDFKGKDRQALWDSGYRAALRALESE